MRINKFGIHSNSIPASNVGSLTKDSIQLGSFRAGVGVEMPDNLGNMLIQTDGSWVKAGSRAAIAWAWQENVLPFSGIAEVLSLHHALLWNATRIRLNSSILLNSSIFCLSIILGSSFSHLIADTRYLGRLYLSLLFLIADIRYLGSTCRFCR